ncbi:MAG: zinc ribbon domain-containing protein [Deltaproteobacteria bacterium]|nr:zinc ribbon domain-containing protein [Deltaproteobacteria bacterium]
MNPRVLKCPLCGAPLTFRAPFCAYCRNPVTWDRDVVIQRGTPFFELDFRQDKLPGWSASKPGKDGTKVFIEKADWQNYGTFEPKVRDACMVIRGVATDPHGHFGVRARISGEGDGHADYKLRVYPQTRSWKLEREIAWGKDIEIDVMVPWEHAPVIADVGQPNEVELRLADAVLQVSVNGQRLTTIFDAGFGFGALGWVVGSLDAPATVMLLSAAAYRAI